MRIERLALPVFLLFSCAVSAWADGMLVGPSHVLRQFRERSQLAVVEVASDKTAEVNLFISLADESGRSHEINFLLPLQTVPRDFKAEEMTREEYASNHIHEIDRLFRESVRERDKRKAASGNIWRAASIAGGPVSLLASHQYPYWEAPLGDKTLSAEGGPALAGIEPTLSVKTEHTEVNVYEALEKDELAVAVALSELPENVSEVLDNYVGKPFALVRFNTVPRPKEDPQQEPTFGLRREESEPGVRFTFIQEMLEIGGGVFYDYPLGTGGGWENPIPFTQVYVVGADELPLEVTFPDRPKTEDLPMGKGSMWHASEITLGFAAEKRQVYTATYYEENPTEDARILLKSSGLGEFADARKAFKKKQVLSWTIFPLLGVLAWLVSFRLVLWNEGYTKQIGHKRALGLSWLMSYMLALPVIAVYLVVAYFGHNIEYSDVMDFFGDSYAAYGILVKLLWIAAGIASALIFLRLRQGKERFIYGCLGVSLVACVIYFALGIKAFDMLWGLLEF